MALYEATNGKNWKNSTNWGTDERFANWHGVTTDAAGRVVSLHLYSNNLTGPIPPRVGPPVELEGAASLWQQPDGTASHRSGQPVQLVESVSRRKQPHRATAILADGPAAASTSLDLQQRWTVRTRRTRRSRRGSPPYRSFEATRAARRSRCRRCR